jgi:hypothetical protein
LIGEFGLTTTPEHEKASCPNDIQKCIDNEQSIVERLKEKHIRHVR